MGKNKNRVVYKPATVELPLDDNEVSTFKITVDGTIYMVKHVETKPKATFEKINALKTGKKTVTREILRKVNNPQLQHVVFMQYLENLNIDKEKLADIESSNDEEPKED